jgi:Proline-rich nuclear receptor coactivator motif
MTKHNTISATAIPATVPHTTSSQPPMNPSALSQQLDQLSLDQKRPSASPKRPSSKRKSKSDITHSGGGTNSPQPQPQQQQHPTHSKRSPKAAKVNGAKQQFSTPSKPKSIPNGSVANLTSQTYGGVAPDLAAHYAGPTFHSSPAPSSLPMPSFFASKPKTSLQNEYDVEGGSPNQTTPVKAVRSLDGHTLHDDSPLAPFFKADREEKSGLLRNRHCIAHGSPTVRPASAGEFHEHLDLRSQSPLMWNDSPRKVNGRLDFKSKYVLANGH